MEVPEGYEPPTFQTAALQHTDVKLTWDADDDNRKRALSSKKLTSDQIREDDFKVPEMKAPHITYCIPHGCALKQI